MTSWHAKHRHMLWLQGKPSPLQSSFKLSYYTLLNLMRRTEGSATHTMEYVIAHSFQQFQQERAAPQVSRASCVCSIVFYKNSVDGAVFWVACSVSNMMLILSGIIAVAVSRC